MTALVSTARAAAEVEVSERTLQRWARAGHVTPARTSPTGQHSWDVEALRTQLARRLPAPEVEGPRYVEAAPVPVEPVEPAPTVRRTVDLPVRQHHALNRLLDDAASARGWRRVNSQDMLATLVARLLADAELQREVIAALPAPARRGTR